MTLLAQVLMREAEAFHAFDASYQRYDTCLKERYGESAPLRKGTYAAIGEPGSELRVAYDAFTSARREWVLARTALKLMREKMEEAWPTHNGRPLRKEQGGDELTAPAGGNDPGSKVVVVVKTRDKMARHYAMLVVYVVVFLVSFDLPTWEALIQTAVASGLFGARITMMFYEKAKERENL